MKYNEKKKCMKKKHKNFLFNKQIKSVINFESGVRRQSLNAETINESLQNDFFKYFYNC